MYGPVHGGQTNQFGIAPVVATVGTTIGKKIFGGVFKRPTPRIYGYLPGTIEGIRSSIEGRGGNRNFPVSDPVAGVNRLWQPSNKDAMGVWRNLLPTWNPTPAALARIRQLDPQFTPSVAGGIALDVQPEPVKVPPIVKDIVTDLLASPEGQKLVDQYGPEVAKAMLQQKQQEAGAFIGKNWVPIALGVGALLLVMGQRR